MFFLFALLAYYAYQRFFISTPFDDVANADLEGTPLTIHFFHVDWCPHCTSAKPEWTTFKNSFHDKHIGKYVVNCVDHNCTNEIADPTTQALLTQYKIESYPTIKMFRGDQTYDFDAKVSSYNLELFVTAAANDA